MGVAGSGKTTVGQRLAADLGWPFHEGDAFHPRANVAKMARGVPLTDRDREPWLRALHRLVTGLRRRRQHGVLACSALEAAHRRMLIGRATGIGLVHLKIDYRRAAQRLRTRTGHFFGPELLASQFEALEEPAGALAVDAAATPAAIVARIERAFGLRTCPRRRPSG